MKVIASHSPNKNAKLVFTVSFMSLRSDSYCREMNGSQLSVTVGQVPQKKKTYHLHSSIFKSVRPSHLVFCALVPAFFYPSLHHSYPSIPSINV